MTLHIISYHGSTDALRFGQASFSGVIRSFLWDRLSNDVRLYESTGWHVPAGSRADRSDARLRAVKAALEAREPRPADNTIVPLEGKGER